MSKSPVAALFMTDAYKLGHRGMYPANTTGVLSNYTNRGSRIDGIDHVVHFGLQAFCQEYLIDAFVPFFAAGEDEVADLYEKRVTAILGPNSVGSDHIRALHRLGYLPLRFCAVPEGTLVPLRVPSFTIENTNPEFAWLVNYIETVVSASYWQASTSATIAHRFRTLLNDAAIRTTGSIAGVEWQGHDFSFRGMAGPEAAARSGAGHLLSFLGSDALNVIDFVEDFYDGDNGMILGSVPATEHSVMCAGGQDDELGKIRRLLDNHPNGILSVVSDTWDLWQVLTEYLPALHEQITARDGKLVIRPDSGNPVDILCGYTPKPRQFENSRGETELRPAEPLPEHKGVVELLWDEFGGTVNEFGFKVLDSHIGTIYGDSITYERAQQIIARLGEKGFASTNVVFGVGSFTYQYQTRDTFGSAVKATWVKVDGEERAIQKAPVTDSGLKRSARGRLAVLRDADGELYLVDGEKVGAAEEAVSELQPVWEDGRFVVHQSFADVRAVLAAEAVAAPAAKAA